MSYEPIECLLDSGLPALLFLPSEGDKAVGVDVISQIIEESVFYVNDPLVSFFALESR